MHSATPDGPLHLKVPLQVTASAPKSPRERTRKDERAGGRSSFLKPNSGYEPFHFQTVRGHFP